METIEQMLDKLPLTIRRRVETLCVGCGRMMMSDRTYKLNLDLIQVGGKKRYRLHYYSYNPETDFAYIGNRCSDGYESISEAIEALKEAMDDNLSEVDNV